MKPWVWIAGGIYAVIRVFQEFKLKEKISNMSFSSSTLSFTEWTHAHPLTFWLLVWYVTYKILNKVFGVTRFKLSMIASLWCAWMTFFMPQDEMTSYQFLLTFFFFFSGVVLRLLDEDKANGNTLNRDGMLFAIAMKLAFNLDKVLMWLICGTITLYIMIQRFGWGFFIIDLP